MLKRLVAAVLEGVLPGALVAFGLSKLGLDATWALYAAVAVVGVLTGLVAGRPVWARGAKTEALLKAVAGALIALVVLFGFRKWLPSVQVDLSAFGVGRGAIGSVPWAFLPSVGVALALVLEIDDAFGSDPAPPQRVASGVRVSPDAPEDAVEQDDSEAARASRRG